MTIRNSPPISLTDVMDELRLGNPGRAYPISLGDTDVRTLANAPTGPVELSFLYGKSVAPPPSEPPPPPPALTVQTTGARGTRSTNNSNGSVSCTVSASASGGTGGYTYQWEFTSNPGQFTLSNSNQANAQVSKYVSRFSSGSDVASLRVTVRDQTGQVVVAEPVYATLEWYGDIAP